MLHSCPDQVKRRATIVGHLIYDAYYEHRAQWLKFLTSRLSSSALTVVTRVRNIWPPRGFTECH